MSEPLHCDGCGRIGLRRLAYPCPPEWFFIKAVDEHTGGDFYVYACSEGCQASLWRRGPGPKLKDDNYLLDVFNRKEYPIPWVCPAGCHHGRYEHSMKGCHHRDGGDVQCGCSWSPYEKSAEAV